MKRKFLKLLVVSLFVFFAASSHAATIWCNPANSGTENGQTKTTGYNTLWEAISAMSSGDEVIIADGDWSNNYPGMTIDNSDGPTRLPKSGSSYNNMSVIKAETDWKVKIPRISDNGSGGVSYVRIQGIVFYNGGTHAIYDWDHCKFIRCGFFCPKVIGNNSTFAVISARDGSRTSEYNLIEECITWGGGRYKFLDYYGRYNIYRRCVARHDWYLDPTTGGGQETLFRGYGVSDSAWQNCIGIDSDRDEYYRGSWESATYWITAKLNTVNGCLAIKGLFMAYYLPGTGTATLSNSIAVGPFLNGVAPITCGAYMKNGGTLTVTNSLFIDIDKSNQYVWQNQGGTLNVVDSIARGTGNQNASSVTNTYHYNVGTGTWGTGCVNEDPYTNGLLYPVRIESGSNLESAGQNGGRCGPELLKRIGVSGKCMDEAGWDTVTDENLWPFPNEAKIKELMSTTVDGVSGTYGFCAGTALDGSPQTLTKYIWEYLGNKIPSEIYGSQQQNTPPVANAGGDQAITDSDNNGSEEVALDGLDSYDLDGSIASYVWSENGQQKATGESPTITLSTGAAYVIKLIVTDNQGATGENTVQITVNPPAGDNTPPVISDVQTGNISSQFATITWKADEPSSSKAEYGESSSYGQEATESSLVTSHAISLSGLQPETAYHFKVISTDSSGNTSESGDFTFTTGTQSAQMNTLQDFEDTVLWQPGGSQDPTGNGRGWAFLSAGSGDTLEIDNIGANGTNRSLKLTFASSNDTIYFRSNDKITDHMPEAENANRMSFYVRFPDGFPIQSNPFRYDTWQLGTFIHDPDNWNDTHAATSEDDHGRHHYYSRLTIEQVGDGWVKYIVNTHPDQASYSGSTVPPDIPYYFDNFGRFYFQFGPEAGGPETGRPFTVWIDEIKFYYDDGSAGGQVHDGGQDDAGFDGQFFADITVHDTIAPGDVTNFNAAPGNSQIALSWINPADTDFKGAMLRYGTGDADNYPVHHQEGILVCNQIGQPGSSDTFMHTKNIQNGTTYYYSAFTYDTFGNYSSTAHAKATPQGTIPPENQPPSAYINGNYKDIEANSKVTFYGTGTDIDGSIVSYHWNFGNGDSSSFQNPSYTFTNQADSTVTLTVTDNKGASGSASIVVVVVADLTPPSIVSAVEAK